MEYTIVGIDFGTSTTVVKVKNYYAGQNPRDYQTLTFNGNSSVPTLIFEDENKHLYFGFEAENQVLAGTTGTLYENFKMDLAGDFEKQEKAKRLIKEFFKYLYSELNQNRQRLNIYPKTKTYISYPAKWTPDTRSFMKKCAVDAGFGNEDTVLGENEPTAAIYSSLLFHLDELQSEHILIKNQLLNVMMIDMGAGTSDIAIFKFKVNSNNKPFVDEIITYPTIDNIYLCGGREIDLLLEKYLCDYVKDCSINKVIPEGITKAIHDSVKSWKERNASPQLGEHKSIGLPGQLSNHLKILQQYNMLKNEPFSGIDRRKFELLTEPHWKQLRSLITESMEVAKNKLNGFSGPEDIDLIILTGGHSQWYGIKEFILGNNFAALEPINFAKIKKQPKRLLQEVQPQETVVHGLVYKDVQFDIKHTMGNSLWIQYELGGKKSEIFKVASHNDVLPLSATNNWEVSITNNVASLAEVEFKCLCYYGNDINTAKTYTTNKKIAFNTIGNSIFGLVGGTIGAAFSTVFNTATGKWDKIIDDIDSSFESNYVFKVVSSFIISEDGSVNIKGQFLSQFSENKEFSIKI